MSRLDSRRSLASLAIGPGTVVDRPLAEAALAEELGPLLGARIAAGALAAEPEAAAMLGRASRECLTRNLVLLHHVEPTLAALRRREIPVLFLKGAALLRGFYQPDERLMWDVDVLVPPARWQEAVTTAAGLGLEPLPPLGRPLTARHDYVRAFRVQGAVLEIHRYLGAWTQFGTDHAGLFARARADHDGCQVPDPVDLFVSLAAHAAKHAFVLPLRSFVDGLRVAAKVDPEKVVVLAQKWQVRRATAAWLGVLLELGLGGAGWQGAAAALGTVPSQARAFLENGPVVASWRYQLRIAQLLDGVRSLAWLTERTALRMGDAVLARVARNP